MRSTRRRAALLALAGVVYAVAAWMVAPGFYDGFGAPQPYNWTCPPPQAGANHKPGSGHLDIKVIGGVSDPNSAFTTDGQVVIGFLPGAFDSTGKSTISVDIKPLGSCPQPNGIRFATNVYQITADAPLVKSANLELVFSNLVAAPSDVYYATDPAGPWKSIGAASQAAPFTIDTSTRSFGYFGAGNPIGSTPSGAPTLGGGQTLPIIVVVLIVVVLLAGLPLAVLRRRRGAGESKEDDGEEE
ncbi:MAG TPA: hypothetical protein VGG90_01170 [Candidatus Dormibacteraeota bacterium]|jgi:hypothetical protein